MLRTIQALSALMPNYVFISTDDKNAFGTVDRLGTLQTTHLLVPELAHCLSLILPATGTPVWLREQGRQWSEHFVHDGIFQGECSSSAFLLPTAPTSHLVVLPPELLSSAYSRLH